MISGTISSVLYVVFCLALIYILSRLLSLLSFHNRAIATLYTLPLNTKMKVRGEVRDEMEMWAVRFDNEESSTGFLLSLEGVPHELKVGDIFEIWENADKTREIRVCKIDHESEFLALNLQ